MKRSLQIGGAFVGLIVGAGFASGQEIMQYFTSFGLDAHRGLAKCEAVLTQEVLQMGGHL